MTRPSAAASSLLLVALALLALLLYRPWEVTAFSILDFSEFLPLVARTGSFPEAVASLSSYYGGHGRFAVLTYAWIAFNWTAFGLDPAGWEWARFALLTVNVVLVFALLRRLGQSQYASALGAALFVVAAPAAGTWIRLTGEPLSVLALLLAGLAATRYQQAARWQPVALLIVLLGAAAVAAKETSVVVLPVLALFACTWRGRRGLGRLRFSRRNVVLLSAMAAATALLVLVILAGMSRQAAEGYARSYGDGAIGHVRYVTYLIVFVLPSQTARGIVGWGPTAVFAVLVVAGWVVRVRSRGRTLHRLAEIGMLAALPLLGAAAYMPWPRLELFYAYPFLFGAAGLLATGVTHLERGKAARSAAVRAAGVILIGLAAVQAGAWARQNAAVQALNADAAHALAQLPRHDLLLVAVAHYSPQEWQSMAPTLRRFALAMGAPADLPPARDIHCSELGSARLEGVRRVALLSFSHFCGRLPQPVRSVTRTAEFIDVATLRRRTTTYHADFVVVEMGGSGAPDGDAGDQR
jgi:hypothetical protein